MSWFYYILYINNLLMKTTLIFLYYVWTTLGWFEDIHLPSGTGFSQWVCVLRPNGTKSMLYYVIYTLPWHNITHYSLKSTTKLSDIYELWCLVRQRPWGVIASTRSPGELYSFVRLSLIDIYCQLMNISSTSE